MKKLHIETPRLLLTTLTPLHTELVLDYYLRNKAFFQPWFPTFLPDYFTLACQHKRLKKGKRQLKDGSALSLWIFEKTATAKRKVIGNVDFTHIIRGPFQSCFLGYSIDKEKGRKGYATEAVSHACNYVFAHLHLHRIEANIMPSNKASIKVVEKLGFINEGLAARYLKIHGRWEDHVHYVLLNEAVE